MGYVAENKRKAYLLVGFFSMLLCGVGDILLSFRGSGEPTAVSGMIGMNIADVPMYYYMLSFFIGIAAAIGFFLGSKAVYSFVSDNLGTKPSKLLKIFSFGTAMLSLGICGIHSVCCMAVMSIRAAVQAGLTAEKIDACFTTPMLVPFAVAAMWQTIADIIIAIAYIGLIIKKSINVSKLWILFGPICLYVIFAVIKIVLTALQVNPLWCNFLSGGETWGLGIMFLAVFVCIKKKTEENQ